MAFLPSLWQPTRGGGEGTTFVFVLCCLETARNEAVTSQFRSSIGSREGKSEAASFNLLLFCIGSPWNARETHYFRPLWCALDGRREGATLVLSFFVWSSKTMQRWLRISALFWASDKAGVRQRFLFL